VTTDIPAQQPSASSIRSPRRRAPQGRRHGEAEYLAVSALMTSSNLLACTTGKVRRFGALEDAAGIDADLTIHVRKVRSVAHEPADFGKVT
jgi:hypothetical protein